MTHRPTVLLLCPAAMAGIAALLYAVNRNRTSTAVLGDIHDSLKENIIEIRALHSTLRRQRGAINDIHHYLIPVSKGSPQTVR